MAKRFWDLVHTKWHPAKVWSWKIKVFRDLLERSEKCQGQNNTLDAHLRHLSCLLNLLSKVNGKKFLRSCPHKVAPIPRSEVEKSKFFVTFWKGWKNVKVNITDWMHIYSMKNCPKPHLYARTDGRTDGRTDVQTRQYNGGVGYTQPAQK